MSESSDEVSISDDQVEEVQFLNEKRKVKPEDEPDEFIQDKILTFDEASKCLHTLGKDESCMRYAYLQFTACDQKLTDIRTLLNFRHVIYVDVSGNYLQTSALQVIAGMPFLMQLFAQRNFLDSCALKPMCYLQNLSLARNRICDTIGVIQPELRYLNLNYNQIYEIIFPSDDVPMLEELEMRGNNLFEVSGKFPESLEKLYLAENNLTRFVSGDLAKLPNLKVLHVRSNNIQKLDGFTSNLTSLKYLNLRNNKITKIRQFRKLQCLPALETIIFLENPVAGNMDSKPNQGEKDEKDEDDDDEELGEDQEEIDPNRVSILALLPNLRRINKVLVTFIEREQACLNKEKTIAEVMDIESSDDEGEPPSTFTDLKATDKNTEHSEHVVTENTTEETSYLGD